VTFGASSGSTGTFVVPTVGFVQSGTGYGAAGTEFTGTLSGGTPSATTYAASPTSTNDVVGSPVTIALTPNGTYSGTVTPSSATGTFSPTTLTWSGTSDMKSFTYTPASTGTKTIAFASSPQLGTDPSVSVVASASGSYTAAANVRNGTDRGDGVTGTLVVPAAANVLTGTTYDGSTAGTATGPTAGQVLTTIQYGRFRQNSACDQSLDFAQAACETENRWERP
jgi:hypothetical protein